MVCPHATPLLASPDRKDPISANALPEIVTKLPPQKLRVCEAAVEWENCRWSPVIQVTDIYDKIENMVLCVGEFARAHGISSGKAYRYLRDFNGIAHFEKFYKEELCLPTALLVEDLATVCRNHGGMLK